MAADCDLRRSEEDFHQLGRDSNKHNSQVATTDTHNTAAGVAIALLLIADKCLSKRLFDNCMLTEIKTIDSKSQEY